MKKRLASLALFSLLSTACVSAVPDMTESEALDLSQGFFELLDSDVQASMDRYFHPELSDLAGLDGVNEIVAATQFDAPQDFSVERVEKEGQVQVVTGQFTCAAASHISDFVLQWLYNSEDQKWEITSFKFEECGDSAA